MDMKSRYFAIKVVDTWFMCKQEYEAYRGWENTRGDLQVVAKRTDATREWSLTPGHGDMPAGYLKKYRVEDVPAEEIVAIRMMSQ